jgi:hypothetical protein
MSTTFRRCMLMLSCGNFGPNVDRAMEVYRQTPNGGHGRTAWALWLDRRLLPAGNARASGSAAATGQEVVRVPLKEPVYIERLSMPSGIAQLTAQKEVSSCNVYFFCSVSALLLLSACRHEGPTVTQSVVVQSAGYQRIHGPALGRPGVSSKAHSSGSGLGPRLLDQLRNCECVAWSMLRRLYCG